MSHFHRSPPMARQARKSAQQVAQTWSQRLQASTQQIQNGVNAVTTSPTQLAAANEAGYLQGVQQAVANGKWRTKLQAVSLSDWKSSMINKGIPHISTGATQAQGKVQTVMGQLLPFIYDTRDAINASNPRGNLQQNMARMNAFVQAMSMYNKS
jgi:hypothetical protein